MTGGRMLRNHKVYHATNPDSLPNPFNWEPRIKLLDLEGALVEMVSQIVAFRLLRGDAADLVLVNEPTVKLKIPTAEWKDEARNVPTTQTKYLRYLHARRTILYGNFHFQSPEGETMFHCNNQKALWYLNRGLVEVVDTVTPTFRFKFCPGGPGHVKDEYYLTGKINQCVVCGRREGLNRHHVIPSCYRKNMGMLLKSHSYHDVLLLCLECHEGYEKEADKLKLEIAEDYDCPAYGLYHAETGEPYPYDEDASRAVRSAAALLTYSDRIPAARQAMLSGNIQKWTGLSVTREEIERVASVKYMRPKHQAVKGYIDHGAMVVRQMTTLGDVQKFAEKWRRHFLDVMAPQYLPAKWDAFKPIISGDCEPDEGGVGLFHDRTKSR